MLDIENAAPMVYDEGTQDLSGRVIPTTSLISPQHLPKFYTFAEKGPVGPFFVDFSQNTLTNLYGDDTFNPEKKYYTHQTLFLQVVASQGNNCVVHRLVAPDAKDVCNITGYLDILPFQVTLYEKNSDGSIKLDSGGLPVPQEDGQGDPILATGYSVCWVFDYDSEDIGMYEQGTKTIRPGIQVDGATQSQQYPIFQVAAADPGEFGKKLGLQMYPALQTDQYPFPTSYFEDSKQYPYYFRLVKLLDDVTGKTRVTLNGYGSQFSRFSTLAGGTDPNTGLSSDFEKIITSQYIDTQYTEPTGLGQVKMYFNNVNTVLTMFYNAEKIISDPHRDSLINTTDMNIHAFNFVSFTSSNGSPYQSIKMVDPVGSSRLTKNSTQYLKGGSDGTITPALLDQLVQEDMELYDDATSEYNDIVLHPESMIYDSGFAMATKRVLPKFISRRKDTFVVTSTYAWNSPNSTIADQYSVGLALKSMFELYPESDTFGTSVMRGMIFGGSGIIKAHPYKNRVPVSYELAFKAARYMGASSGAWKNGYVFDRAPRSVFEKLQNVDVTWVPAVSRRALWAVGINFALNYKVKSQFFPALQTVYEDDTSVLNSFFVAVAISYINKIAHSAWREFSGVVTMSPAQLEEAVNTYMSEQTKDKFDGMFKIIPNAKVTEFDEQRGYSWTLVNKLGANNMRTVMTTSTQAYRMSDLPE